MKRASRPSRAPFTAKKRQSNATHGASGQIRIIGGQWRGRKLPVRDVTGLRPTTDRNKETLFNWLMHKLTDAVCIDVFAGSGGLGFEALSRYAKHCDFIEKDSGAFNQLVENTKLLRLNSPEHVSVLQGDALSILSSLSKNSFDIAFVDPPFGKGLVQPVLDLIDKHQLMASNGVIYIEQESGLPWPTLPAHWQLTKSKETSSLMYGLIEIS
ncbi:16S rRNA (guanine(966)-N(2))-methyltransferase RsmD [Alteromonas sp. KUL49]|uniref:16S rRNA (guanine(966)-N(2))-methyltransferase RsmD n=1 Tax=Alteromonas sp. KUL49 TaxID=2480798 RepID=UPI00102ED858|nr:16S rRNA (guanine(966)-N(2))-methyltransferase RsmD [Alteromonas sp. KUL49]TAP37974.1 16S rRNA (guanine(966)-N(2))-methyltransferase RsmD [Alteromonas sp. KUL49]GEA12846.1 ribosomal RNA small subunit methyltransferase D [Alteromonas sp. KUL49]